MNELGEAITDGEKTGGCLDSLDCSGLIHWETVNLDTFWIRAESLEDSENLLEPDVILQEMIGDLENARGQLRGIAKDLGQDTLW